MTSKLAGFALSRVVVLTLLFATLHATGEVAFEKTSKDMKIRIDGKPMATYVWSDEKTLRPYFANVFAPNGMQVTRIHPPDPVVNRDNSDHETMHPGIWLAFGEINGMDTWRNKARVRHIRFVAEPSFDGEQGTYTVLNAYEPLDGSKSNAILETCRYDIFALDMGWFLLSQSVFRSNDGELRFGDQEEMGFGVRLNTPITVKYGTGAILNSEGGRNEYGTWGQRAKWCSFFGNTNDGVVGITIMPGAENFRPSWFHSRDYGLVVANPFGKKAMTAADDTSVQPDATTIPAGEPFRLTNAVYIFATKGAPDNATAYDWFQELLAQSEAPEPATP
ncbi:MAG TPA: PmoA family protein [Candidatus Hydrogenedentes bacterium]|nr:PmoA family protein [Candidatus Hydrogenedentota bacterium]